LGGYIDVATVGNSGQQALVGADHEILKASEVQCMRGWPKAIGDQNFY